MDPSDPWVPKRRRRLPRVSGDGPDLVIECEDSHVVAPRERGWTRPMPERDSGISGCPA